MNKDDAIKAIQDFIGWFKPDSRIYKALQMAIKALSQEPICPSAGVDCKDCPAHEPCDDVVCRDMALEKMADYVASGYADSVEDFEEYSRIICQLPSVTQNPDNKYRKEAKRWKNKWLKSHKSGKWVLNKEKSHFFDVYECSNCGKISGLTNYCPNCGAKMESEV